MNELSKKTKLVGEFKQKPLPFPTHFPGEKFSRVLTDKIGPKVISCLQQAGDRIPH